MGEKESHQSEEYKRVRDSFEDLPLQDRAAFLVEAVFSTLTKGIESAGRAVSEELASMFEQAREAAESAAREAREHAEEAAEEAEAEAERASSGEDAGAPGESEQPGENGERTE